MGFEAAARHMRHRLKSIAERRSSTNALAHGTPFELAPHALAVHLKKS
jgi:hypothetical protein